MAATPEGMSHRRVKDHAGRTLRRVRIGYIFALTVLAVLTLASQVLVQRNLGSQERDAEIINVAGRQRMLSQRLALQALQVAERTDATSDLRDDLRSFEASHHRLFHGDLGRFADTVGEVASRALDRRAAALVEAAQAALHGEGTNDALSASNAFLAIMDDAVFRYSRAAERARQQTQFLELLFAIAALLILAIEALVIFRPLLRKLSDAVERLRSLANRLGESEATHARALAGSQDGIFDWNTETGELHVSDRFSELTGIDVSRWQDFIDLVAPADRERVHLALKRDHIDLELRFQTPFGPRWVRLVGARSDDAHIAGVLSDIDERRRLEADRERLLEARERDLGETREHLVQSELLNSVGTLAAGVAHDFNNYLQVIRLAASAVRGSEDPEESLRTIEEASSEAGALAAQLLSLRDGYSCERSEAVDIRELLTQTCNLVRRTLPNEVHLIEKFGTDLPTLHADTAQLRQLVINLCLNARDAMKAGGRVFVRAVPRERFTVHGTMPGVELSVEDEGEGMGAQQQRRMFDPFYTTRGHGKGAGLGLTVVHSIIRRHGGTIDVESATGAGTLVRVWLPEGTSGEAFDGPRISVHDLRVLVVDDEPGIRRAARTLLCRAGHEVVLASSCEEARGHLGKSSYDLIICDVMLPDGRGPELIAGLPDEERPPVLYITGYTATAVQTDARSDLLRKPFSGSDLNEALTALMNRVNGAEAKDTPPSRG
ncbi:MAG: ATP-binding protein [Myxococcota bacterium]